MSGTQPFLQRQRPDDMKKIKKFACSLLLVTCLFLSLTSFTFALRCTRHTEVLSKVTNDGDWWLIYTSPCLWICRTVSASSPPYDAHWYVDSYQGRLRVDGTNFVSFERIIEPGCTFDNLMISWWLLAVVLSLPPVARLSYFVVHRRLRARMKARGFCHQCGYDVRASTDRCPECGTSTPESSSPNSGADAALPK